MKYIIGFLITAVVIILIYIFIPYGNPEEDYIEFIMKRRMDIEKFMKLDPDSPFIKKGSVEFKGLTYYDIDPAFRVIANITILENPEIFTISMSDGSHEKYYRYASAEFHLTNEPQKLTLLKSEKYWGESWVFLPFYDETSANETYGGGRYLEIGYNGETALPIDFNLSYNPYCAYTDTYACPIPPIENHITVEVKAGEKIYNRIH